MMEKIAKFNLIYCSIGHFLKAKKIVLTEANKTFGNSFFDNKAAINFENHQHKNKKLWIVMQFDMSSRKYEPRATVFLKRYREET